MGASLDPLSTKQTSAAQGSFRAQKCANGAPFIAYRRASTGKWHVAQGSCNSWLCPRCGQIRAKKEYGRMVHGARELSGSHTLYLFTITTKGAGLSVATAHESYYEWTNRLLTALRTDARRRGAAWHYAAVTEHQKRGHPHSHLITSYRPKDVRMGWFYKWRTGKHGKYKEYYETLRSAYLLARLKSAGLGEVYDYNEVLETEAASRYIAKYLFKSSMFTDEFPKNWKRIRYSRGWPKLPEASGEGFPLLTDNDWRRLSVLAATVAPDDPESLLEVIARMKGSDILIDRRAIMT